MTSIGPEADGGRVVRADHVSRRGATEPCLHCGTLVTLRKMGCKAGHCPNCRHPYPHGDCSD
jgi:hypothetical protein